MHLAQGLIGRYRLQGCSLRNVVGGTESDLLEALFQFSYDLAPMKIAMTVQSRSRN